MASIRAMTNLTLSVRFNASIPRTVQADTNWTVLQLKEAIAKSHEVSIEEVKLVFQGKELSENMKVEDLDLGNYSVLDAVKYKGMQGNYPALEAVVPDFVGSVRLSRASSESPGSGDSGVASGSSSTASAASPAALPPSLRNCFYVYCKSQCKDIRPGKLRVRCAKCKKGTLCVEKDPSGWDDVLKKNQIEGECQLDECDGEYAEFYFKCNAHPVEENETSVVLPQVKTNSRRIPCIVCEEPFDAQIVYDCPSQHTICFACFHQYAVTNLNERRFTWSEELGYNLACPGADEGCNSAFLPMDGHYFRIMGSDDYDKYQMRATEEFIQNMEGGTFCPAPNCGAGIIFQDDSNHVVCRPGCGYEFCRLCKGAYHEGRCGEARRESLMEMAGRGHIDPAAAERARWMLADIDKIAEISKPCPQCQAPIEKNEGCMHMRCLQCRHEFCWMCLTPWDRSCQEDHWFG